MWSRKTHNKIRLSCMKCVIRLSCMNCVIIIISKYVVKSATETKKCSYVHLAEPFAGGKLVNTDIKKKLPLALTGDNRVTLHTKGWGVWR